MRHEIQLQLCLLRVTPDLIEDGKRVVASRGAVEIAVDRKNLCTKERESKEARDFSKGKLKMTIDFYSLLNNNIYIYILQFW